jgi:hypothetical protein
VDACRGVDLTDIDDMRKNLKTNGAVISHSCKVLIRPSSYWDQISVINSC